MNILKQIDDFYKQAFLDSSEDKIELNLLKNELSSAYSSIAEEVVNEIMNDLGPEEV